MKTAIEISLTRSERDTLRRWAKRSNPRLAQRARIVLLAADGWANNAIADELGTDPHTVGRWRRRFAAQRLAGIEKEALRSGRRRQVREGIESKVLRLTARYREWGRPCSSRDVARALGVNHMLVYRIWKEHELIS